MADESKLDDPATTQQAVAESSTEIVSSNNAQVESEDDEEHEDTSAAVSSATKKKKSKRKRIKAALTGKSGDSGESSEAPSKDQISKAVSGLSNAQVQEFLAMNPALAQEMGVGGKDLSGQQAAEAMKKLSLEDIMTGLAANGKNVKDMASYKFWQTQPVPKFGEKLDEIEEGPFKAPNLDEVPKEPGPLVDGFEWVTMDLTNDEELREVFELLYGHYVEDNEAMFRFNYSGPFLRW
jgi:glycylpeptide N-tetradecanoyltransferase